MTRQVIGIGSAPNDGTGDTARVAFDKCNDNFAELYGGNWIYARNYASLEAALADVSGECTLVLEAEDYTWPDDTEWPLGLNCIGHGYESTGTETSGIGTRINSTGRIVQSQGAARGTIIQGVYFHGGFQVRKQNTTFIGCRFDGEGLLLGDNDIATSPYYTTAINCRYSADEGESCITFENTANGNYLHGQVFVPQYGRGVSVTGLCAGNRLDLTYDIAASTHIGAVVWIGNNATGFDINFTYWEPGTNFTFVDGALLVFAETAGANRIRVPVSDPGRIYHNSGARYNEVICSWTDWQYSNGDVTWTNAYGNAVMTGTGNDVWLPPLTTRRGQLALMPNNPSGGASTIYAPFVVSAVAVNTAGSGGTDGTYYQNITDANVVSGHGCTVKITVAGGVMTAVELLYPGWFKAAGAATVAVTAATNLVGGVIGLTWDAHQIWNGSTAADTVTVNAYTFARFLVDPSGMVWWRV